MSFILLTGKTLCEQPVVLTILGFVGTIIQIIRWGVPIALIVYGSIDLGKAIMEKEEKKIKDGYTKLGKKFAVAIVVFLIPGLLSWMLSAFGVGKGELGETTKAAACLNEIFPGFADIITAE